MSQIRVFSLLGDSNVRRHITKTTCRASPAVKSAQILACGHLEIFAETLNQVRQESNICIVSCVTNFITSADGPAAISQRVEPVLEDVRDALIASCEANPACQFLISPPMYRSSPVWYREGLPEILTLFSGTLGSDRPSNLHILPSFSLPEFEADGVHLTVYSALQFILHLFDSAQDLVENLSSDQRDITTRNCEASRVLEDRVMVLEQDHRRLNRVVENKIAIDSELSDFHQNERFEDSFVVTGLAAISPDLVGKDWQIQAVKDVQVVLKSLMGKELPILFVKNSTKRHQGAEISYTVRMQETSDAKAIRRKFGSFYLGGQDKRPPALDTINIKNQVTPETNTRISILKLLAKRYRDSNPGSKVQVIGYDPRPVIKIIPSSSATDRRILTYHYVEAVTKLPTNFSAAEVEPILRRINPALLGKIRSLFVCLSDDDFKKLVKPLKSKQQAAADQPESSSAAGSESESEGTRSQAANPVSQPSAQPATNQAITSRNSRKRGASTGSSGSGNPPKK